MKIKNAVIVFFSALCFSTSAAQAFSNDVPYIARWYQNYDGAVSLRFDDGLESHVNTVIPLLNRHGFRALFLVNPGTERYQTNRNFWEKQAPAMGHRLANHTMNHHGAGNLKEAEFEIGETAQYIRRIDPQNSPLLVFASGGGRARWGGMQWEVADPAYRQLTEKYQLIDLYDGKHPYVSIRAHSSTEDICALFGTTAAEKKHLCLAFHHVGNPSFLGFIKAFVKGDDLVFSEHKFQQILQCLAVHRKHLWVAPLIDILKYEEEVHGAKITILEKKFASYNLVLQVQTHPALYDQKLTLVVPVKPGVIVTSVRQDNEDCRIYRHNPAEVLVDIKPVGSTIIIQSANDS